jgi:hypothetical protein
MRLQNPFPLSHIPGEERNEFVTVSRESILNSVSDTGNSGKLRLRRHHDEKERSQNVVVVVVVVVSCGSDQKTWTGLELEFIG